MKRPLVPTGVGLTRSARVALWGFVFGMLVLKATLTLGDLGRAALAPGPNTTGEAGKVYFAARVQEGRSPFDDGTSPPYYPSVHGALVHATVGGLGALVNASTTGLYAIGRGLSVLLTIGALGLLFDLGRRLEVRPALLLAGLVLWLGNYELIIHTVSYRPDNWLFFLSVLACWLVSTRPDGRFSFWALAAIPVVAFHVKSPGIALIIAIVLALMLQGRRRHALLLGSVQLGLVLLSVLAMDALAGGAYLEGLRAIGKVPISAGNIPLVPLPDDPIIPWILAFPLLILMALARECTTCERPAVCSLTVFWVVTLGVYTAASARSGSNLYYFLEPATYGLLLGLVWLAGPTGGRGHVVGKAQVPTRLIVVGVITAFLAFPTGGALAAHGRIPDVAVFRSEQLADVRGPLAERLNDAGLRCYSDDPGLNVLLERPGVIYPLLQRQMIDAGTLDQESLLRPIEASEFDCVVLSGVRWNYRGEPVLSDAFFDALRRNYRPAENVGRYTLFLPRRADGASRSPSGGP